MKLVCNFVFLKLICILTHIYFYVLSSELAADGLGDFILCDDQIKRLDDQGVLM